jgi:hypothetical protein
MRAIVANMVNAKETIANPIIILIHFLLTG